MIERASVLSQGGAIDIKHLPREMTETAQPLPGVASTEQVPAYTSLELNPAVDKLENAMISCS